MEERRTEWARRARFEEIRQDVGERIRHLLPAFSSEDAEALLRRMTLLQLKYEGTDHTRTR
jgi:hypothetical protein